jgi:putative copper resistance protein D
MQLRPAPASNRPGPATPAPWIVFATTAALGASVLTAVTAGSAVSRTVMDVAGVAVVGLALLRVLLPARHKQVPAVRDRTDRWTVVATGIWLTATLLVIVQRVADAAARPLDAVGVAELTAWSTGVGAGQGMLLSAAAVTIVLVGAVVRLRRPALLPPRAVLAAAVFAMITPAVTGHSAAAGQYQVIAVIGIGVHVAAAAAWVGGLAALLVLVRPHRGLLVAVLPRFSHVATACIAAVTATGMLTTAIHVATGHGTGHSGGRPACMGSRPGVARRHRVGADPAGQVRRAGRDRRPGPAHPSPHGDVPHPAAALGRLRGRAHGRGSRPGRHPRPGPLLRPGGPVPAGRTARTDC